MGIHERDNLREFLVALFGNQASSWPMNKKIFNLTYKLVDESSACSNAMNLVPRPMPYGVNPFSWLKQQARASFLRNLKMNKGQYIVCLKSAAVRMVRDFQMAAIGI